MDSSHKTSAFYLTSEQNSLELFKREFSIMAKAKLFAVAFLTLGVLCFVGCGAKDKGYRKVTGTVTLNGEPLDGATVMFYNQAQGGDSGAGKTGADGSFTVTSSRASEGGTGLVPGEYKVTVTKFEEVVDPDQEAFDKGEITYDELQERKAKAGAYAKAKAPKLLTPSQYQRADSTPFTASVTDDPKQNVYEFNLEE